MSKETMEITIRIPKMDWIMTHALCDDIAEYTGLEIERVD